MLRNNKIETNQLESIRVTLNEPPKYLRYKAKFSTYNEIVFNTKEYKRSFRIDSKTFFATDHSILQNIAKDSDTLFFLVLKSDYIKFNDNSNKDIILYGLYERKVIDSPIDLDKRSKLFDKDDRFCIVLLMVGIVFMIFSFSSIVAKVDFDGLMFIVVLTSTFFYYFFLY